MVLEELTASGIPAPDCHLEFNSKLNLNYSKVRSL